MSSCRHWLPDGSTISTLLHSVTPIKRPMTNCSFIQEKYLTIFPSPVRPNNICSFPSIFYAYAIRFGKFFYASGVWLESSPPSVRQSPSESRRRRTWFLGSVRWTVFRELSAIDSSVQIYMSLVVEKGTVVQFRVIIGTVFLWTVGKTLQWCLFSFSSQGGIISCWVFAWMCVCESCNRYCALPGTQRLAVRRLFCTQ